MLHETLNDRCVLAFSGSTVHLCMGAQKELETLGIHVSVLNVYCLSPLDRWALLGAYGKTGCLIVVDEAFPNGGLASTIAEAVPVSAAIGGITDCALSTGPITRAQIVETVLETLNIDPADAMSRSQSLK